MGEGGRGEPHPAQWGPWSSLLTGAPDPKRGPKRIGAEAERHSEAGQREP